jgi:diketogulonate reductase-like aldo/keto reductase
MDHVETNGARIPAIGLGTWELRGRACARVVNQALRLGYRHIDTAEMYDNEREIGEGLRESGIKREEVFVTTKVWQTHLAPPQFERSTKESLVRMRLSDVNLLLIHWPTSQIPLAETIGALCKMKKEGYARHIGISNFTVPLVEEAVKYATEPLVTNQIEWHPYLDQSKVVGACREHGMAVTAYSPIARGKAAGDKVLSTIGMAYGKTAGQVSLRYLVQEGAIVIPRTSRVERLSENMEIFDFALADEEMEEIRKLARPSGRVVDWAGAPRWD